MKDDKKHITNISAIALWISILIFVLVTIWIIQVFDSQGNQDQEKLNRQLSEQVKSS
jgi:cytoskeletal protein RodZ